MFTRRPARQHVVALAVAASLGLVACGGGDDDSGMVAPPAGSIDLGPVVTAADDGGDSEAPAVTPGTVSGPVVQTLPPDTAPAEPEAVQGGTLRLAVEAEVDGLNPVTNQVTAASGLMMAAAVFDTLAATNVDGDPVPYLAESFSPNEDYTVWEVRLRPGITFHDGTPLDAAAVERNFTGQLNDPLVGLAVKPFYPETGAIEIVDELTLRYRLLESNARWPGFLATQIGMVASPAWLDAALADPSLNQQPVGTGPFKFESRSEDSVTRFVRNDDYWHGTVYLDAVEYLPVPESAAAADLLRAGQINGLHTSDGGVVADLRGDTSLQTILDDTGDEEFIMMNAEQPPFDDIRARQALAYATPRQNALDLVWLGQWRPATQRFTPESPYYNPDLVQVSDDPATAIALATEYCNERGGETNPVTGGPTCTDGKINIEYQYAGPSVIQTRLGDVLVEGWSAAFNVDRQEVLQDQGILEVATGAYNAVDWAQFNDPEPLDDSVWLLCRTIGGISLNFPRLCDTDRDALLLQAAASADDGQRAALMQQAEALINQSFTYVFFGHVLWDFSFRENVRGVCDRTSPEGERLMCARQGFIWPTTVWLD